MNFSASVSPMPDVKKHKSAFCRVVSTVILLSAAFFIASAIVVTDYKQRFFEWRIVDDANKIRSKTCEDQSKPYGTEGLPRGIVSRNSDLEMRPLLGPMPKKNAKSSMSLLAMAVGIKQKESVNKIINKFALSNFAVMLFHYDGIVNDWREFEWSDLAIHVSALGQTKWWFAKRFLHPDIVSEYAYIFLWDEDLGVEDFNAGRYISIIKEEGLEISQPALDPDKSDVHHHLTARNSSSNVHRRIHRSIGGGRKCDENSTGPPCTGWVEMMAPVFSRTSWHCVWHMIQNDLVHAWGLDFQLGYCAQGDRTKNIGIIDSEYIIHYGLPTLGDSTNETNAETSETAQPSSDSKTLAPSSSQRHPHHDGIRQEVRRRSYVELDIFKNRWKNAVKKDECWIDPFQ